MFVMTAKLSKTKLIAAAVILIAVIAGIAMLLSKEGNTQAKLPSGSSDQERAAYLATFGWSVNATPKEMQQVKIPDTQDNMVFARYNELQLSQGFDLRAYAGKEVNRFVYEILNYPDAKAPVFASILVYQGQIIGGDITDTAPDGVIHGFQKPDGAKAPSAQLPTEPKETTPSITEPITKEPETEEKSQANE